MQQISNKCLSCCSQRRRRSCDSTMDTYHSWITTKQTVREKIIIVNNILIYISSPLATENWKPAYSPTYNTNFVQKCLSRSRNLSYYVAKTRFCCIQILSKYYKLALCIVKGWQSDFKMIILNCENYHWLATLCIHSIGIINNFNCPLKR